MVSLLPWLVSTCVYVLIKHFFLKILLKFFHFDYVFIYLFIFRWCSVSIKNSAFWWVYTLISVGDEAIATVPPSSSRFQFSQVSGCQAQAKQTRMEESKSPLAEQMALEESPSWSATDSRVEFSQWEQESSAQAFPQLRGDGLQTAIQTSETTSPACS